RGQPERRVGHRLGAGGGQVDDRQSAMGQRDAPVLPDAVTVGATRSENVRHPGNRVQVDRVSVEPDFTGDAAHGQRPYADRVSPRFRRSGRCPDPDRACRGGCPPVPRMSTAGHRCRPRPAGSTDTAPVAAFDLPLSVTTGSSTIQLVLELPAALPWAEVADAVRVAAGLSPGTPLLHRGTEVSPTAVVGVPPLLAGAQLTTGPSGTELPTLLAGPLVVSCVAGPDAGRSLPVLHDPVVV